MKINWNFLGGGGGGAKQKPSMGGVWLFSGTAHMLCIAGLGCILSSCCNIHKGGCINAFHMIFQYF